MRNPLLIALVFFAISTARSNAGAAYPDPSGGWTYRFDGDAAKAGTGGFDALDGTWSVSNGSSEWDGSAVGGTIGTSNKPGGAGTLTEGNLTYLRIQDTGNPSQYSGANNGCNGCNLGAPSNRKILFGHDMTAEGCPDTVLDDGFTLTFRARIPTPAKSSAPPDRLYPNGEAGNGPQPYPAGGDGYLIADNGYGLFSIRQFGGGKLAFSLVTSNDTLAGLTATPKANFQGLQVNGLNGTTPNNNIDFNEAPAQFLPLDPTEWNEFWIVAQRDNSGQGTHTVLVYANGSLAPRVFHVTAASSAGEYSGVSSFNIGMSQTAQCGAVDIDFLAYRFEAVLPPGAAGLPPEISNVTPLSPTQGNLFYPSTNGVSFSASSVGSKTIPNSGVKLVLNGADVSSALKITGSNSSLNASYNALLENTVYSGQITVTDSGGLSSTYPLQFDTFTERSAIVIEAEDYNHSGGQFADRPAPNAYAALSGKPEIDFHDATTSAGDYRGDAVDTAGSPDTVRPNFSAAGAADFEVTAIEQGEWLNYTRTFAAGPFNVFLRYASQAEQDVRLDLVTGDRTKSNQSTAALGAFRLNNNGTLRGYAPLSDAFGKPVAIRVSDVQTLRLTAPDASLNLQLNFLVFVPLAPSGVSRLPSIGFASPGPDSTDFLPDASIRIGLLNGDTAVAPGSINLQFDGANVTSNSAISPHSAGVFVLYAPPAPLAINSPHTIRLVFADNATPPRSFTNEWNFKTANLPVLLSSWATATGSGKTKGFQVKMRWHQSGQDLLFPNNSVRAEDQLADLLNDAGTGQPYTNEAGGPNNDGLFAEPDFINYSDDATDRGVFGGDHQFPYIDVPAAKHVAMAVTAYLEMPAGLHRFGVRRDAGFKLSAGPDFTRKGASLTLGAFEPGGESPTATTEFDFVVPSAGVYPFRLVFFQNSGPSDIEWYSVNRTTGAATLINDTTQPGSIKAFMERTSSPPATVQILASSISGANFQFTYATTAGKQYVVEFKNALSDPSWQSQPAVAGDGSVKSFSAPVNAVATRFYRLRVQ